MFLENLFNALFFTSFSEMPTNNFVESSFWNFDALFQPQQHPARDAHDTFFTSGKTVFEDQLVLIFKRTDALFQNQRLAQISQMIIWRK